MALSTAGLLSLDVFPKRENQGIKNNLDFNGLSVKVRGALLWSLPRLWLNQKHPSKTPPISIHTSHLPVSPKVIIEELRFILYKLNHS